MSQISSKEEWEVEKTRLECLKIRADTRMIYTKYLVAVIVGLFLFFAFDYHTKALALNNARNELGRKQLDIIIERLFSISDPYELDMTYLIYKDVFDQIEFEQRSISLDTIIAKRTNQLYYQRQLKEDIHKLTRKLELAEDTEMKELLIRQIEISQSQLDQN